MLSIRKVCIIGGTGHMGQWFSKFFIDHGCEVTISGRNLKKCARVARQLGSRYAGMVSSVKGADLVLISVTPQAFESVARKIGPSIAPGQAVIDITSVKAAPVGAMHRHMGHATVLGTHPMFGPTYEAEGQNFVLTPTNAAERRFASSLAAYLKAKGFKVVVMSPAEHDKMIGVMLSLTHFVGFVTADTWMELGAGRMSRKGGTSFKLLKAFAASILRSSPELYSYLQAEVPAAYLSEKVFAAKAKEWSELSRTKKSREIARRMLALRRYVKRM